MKIVVSGKCGEGKTALVSLIAEALAAQGIKIAVDAAELFEVVSMKRETTRQAVIDSIKQREIIVEIETETVR